MCTKFPFGIRTKALWFENFLLQTAQSVISVIKKLLDSQLMFCPLHCKFSAK